MAFYDAKHKGSRPNRRDTQVPVAVWEIHPVMALTVLANAASSLSGQTTTPRDCEAK
jgi:hypothetical protein